MLYACCAFLVIIVLWGFHFFSPFTYGHVALSSADINRRKWLSTWDMLSHANTWHALHPSPLTKSLPSTHPQTSLRAEMSKDLEIRQRRAALFSHSRIVGKSGNKCSALGCLGLLGLTKEMVSVILWRQCIVVSGCTKKITSCHCCHLWISCVYPKQSRKRARPSFWRTPTW